jgi:hypothetical protein
MCHSSAEKSKHGKVVLKHIRKASTEEVHIPSRLPAYRRSVMENGKSSMESIDNGHQNTVEELRTSESNDNSSAAHTEQNNKVVDMKLVIRSPYWGRVLKGKTRRDPLHPTRQYRIFQCQAVLTNVLTHEGRYWGCCPNHGKRVFELKEYHFAEHYPHDWDLYMMGSAVTPTNVVHSFFLLPQNQTAIDINAHLHYDGWTYVGSVNASALRLDLQSLLYDFLIQNKDYGYNFHHVHVDLLMNQVTDREAIQSQRKTEAKRSEKQTQAQRGSNKQTSKAQQSGLGGNPPPIPHVVSNDASWATDTTRSSSTASAGGGIENWNDSFHPAYGYRSPAGPWPNHQARWISAASSIPSAAHTNDSMGLNHASAAPLPPIQQVLQNFPMPMMSMPTFPVGFVPPPYYVQQQLAHSAAPEGWGTAGATEPYHYCPHVGMAYGEPSPAPQDNTVYY